MSTTTEHPTVLPLDRLRPNPKNPRGRIDADELADLAQSIRVQGIISPLAVVAEGDDYYMVVAGHRRLAAAEMAGVTEVPVHVLDDADLATVLADNVVRSDLSILDEAHAYDAIAQNAGGPTLSVEQVAGMVGKSEDVVRRRLALLDVDTSIADAINTGRLPVRAGDTLVTTYQADNLLGLMVMENLDENPVSIPRFASDPGWIVDRVLGDRPLRMGDQQLAQPVAYSAGGNWDPILPRCSDIDKINALAAKLGEHGKRIIELWDGLPPVEHRSGYDYAAQRIERDRWDALFDLSSGETIDAARAYGCLLELRGSEWDEAPEEEDDLVTRYYLTDAEWIADQIAQRFEGYEPDVVEKRDDGHPSTRKTQATAGSPEAEAEAKKQRAAERQAEYDKRVAARGRNLDLGAALTGYEPSAKDELDAAKLLATVALDSYAEAGVWAFRLLVPQPESENKAKTRVTVHYPRDGAEKTKLLDRAYKQVKDAKTIHEAMAVPLRVMMAQVYVDVTGLPGADTAGVQTNAYSLTPDRSSGYDTIQRGKGQIVKKLAASFLPASVKKERAAEAKRRKEQQERVTRQVAERVQAREKAAGDAEAAGTGEGDGDE